MIVIPRCINHSKGINGQTDSMHNMCMNKYFGKAGKKNNSNPHPKVSTTTDAIFQYHMSVILYERSIEGSDTSHHPKTFV